MKKASKISALPLCLVVAALATGCGLSQSEPSLASGTGESQSRKDSPPSQQPKPGESKTQLIQPYARTPFLGLEDPRWAERRRLHGSDPSYEWKTPIRFYGKVVDDSNQPVSGAVIEIEWPGTVERNGGDGVGHRRLNNEANGTFTIAGIEGKCMIVRVSKDGYRTRGMPLNNKFEYAGFWEPCFIEPDPALPVVFRLVKKREAEPTYRIHGRFMIQAPALELRLDLLSPTLQTVTTEDIFLRISRGPSVSDPRFVDWTVEIEGRNGCELAASDDEFMLQAPTDGYTPTISREYKKTLSNQDEKIRFYVRNSARDFYATVEIQPTPYRYRSETEPAVIKVMGTVNPNNSTNLEYDPEKDIREARRK